MNRIYLRAALCIINGTSLRVATPGALPFTGGAARYWARRTRLVVFCARRLTRALGQ